MQNMMLLRNGTKQLEKEPRFVVTRLCDALAKLGFLMPVMRLELMVMSYKLMVINLVL